MKEYRLVDVGVGQKELANLEQQVNELAKEGFRVIGFNSMPGAQLRTVDVLPGYIVLLEKETDEGV